MRLSGARIGADEMNGEGGEQRKKARWHDRVRVGPRRMSEGCLGELVGKVAGE